MQINIKFDFDSPAFKKAIENSRKKAAEIIRRHGRKMVRFSGIYDPYLFPLSEKDLKNIEQFLRHYRPSVHQEIIDFLKARDGSCDWTDRDLTPALMKKLDAAIIDDIVGSYTETETYMLHEWNLEETKCSSKRPKRKLRS